MSDQRSGASSPDASSTPDTLKAEAAQHLDFAIEEFHAMKMQPFLERALAARENISR